MSGPSLVLDERVHAYRRDIADVALAGQLIAPHYARPMMRVAAGSATSVVEKPVVGAEVVSELNPGEEFAILDLSGGWAWGYRRLNHRVGYVSEADLLAPDAE